MRLIYLLTSILCIGGLTFAGGNHARSLDYSVLSQLVHRDSVDEHLPDKCGLPALSAALHNRSSLSPQLRAALDAVLLRPTLDTSIRVGNYRIHYDTAGANAPAMLDQNHQRIPGTERQYVDSVAAVLAYVTSIDTNVLGYLPPPRDNGSGGGQEYDVYISELGGLYYGLTTPETPINNKPDGGTFTTFLEIDNDFQFVSPDSNKGIPGLKVTIAHELHHAIQIGNYGFWTGETYFYEMTSVWLEDVAYTEVNDYYQYLRSSQGQFRRPDISFTSNNFIAYSRGIWGHFIAKRYSRDAMRFAWQEIANVRPLQAMDNALRRAPYSSSFRQAFSEWTLWNFFTGYRADTIQYYSEGLFYPPMVQTPVWFAPPSRSVTGSLGVLAATYYQVLGRPDTLTLALSNINFVAALGNSGTQFPYTYLLNISQPDELYRSTPVGIFFKLDVPDVTNWYTWDIVGRGVGSSTVATGVPYPNPLIADGKTSLYIPVNSAVSIQGTLSVFSSSMDLVFASTLQSVAPQPGKQVFAWNGTTNSGEIVQTGVYLLVLEALDQTITGKIAVLRK